MNNRFASNDFQPAPSHEFRRGFSAGIGSVAIVLMLAIALIVCAAFALVGCAPAADQDDSSIHSQGHAPYVDRATE